MDGRTLKQQCQSHFESWLCDQHLLSVASLAIAPCIASNSYIPVGITRSDGVETLLDHFCTIVALHIVVIMLSFVVLLPSQSFCFVVHPAHMLRLIVSQYFVCFKEVVAPENGSVIAPP